MDSLVFPFFFPFRSRPLIGGAGIAGKVLELKDRKVQWGQRVHKVRRAHKEQMVPMALAQK